MRKIGRWQENGLWRVLTPIHTAQGTLTLSMQETTRERNSERYHGFLYSTGNVLVGEADGPTTWALESWAHRLARDWSERQRTAA